MRFECPVPGFSDWVSLGDGWGYGYGKNLNSGAGSIPGYGWGCGGSIDNIEYVFRFTEFESLDGVGDGSGSSLGSGHNNGSGHG